LADTPPKKHAVRMLKKADLKRQDKGKNIFRERYLGERKEWHKSYQNVKQTCDGDLLVGGPRHKNPAQEVLSKDGVAGGGDSGERGGGETLVGKKGEIEGT